jgi:antitoxin component HigA of HigAB toxin-antitoxin module
MDIKPIRTVADHAWALREIQDLWEKAEPGTANGDRFEVLSALVDAYERERFAWSKRGLPTTTYFRSSRRGRASRR